MSYIFQPLAQSSFAVKIPEEAENFKGTVMVEAYDWAGNCREEIRTVRRYSSLPVTTNMMSFFKPLDYFKWAKELDIVSWDCYGDWHSQNQDDIELAVWGAAYHSIMRSMKKAPISEPTTNQRM